MGQAHVWRGLGAGLGGLGWCERLIEVRFVWARRMFGVGLARVWHGFGAAPTEIVVNPRIRTLFLEKSITYFRYSL